MTEGNVSLPQEIRNRVLKGVHYNYSKRQEVLNNFVSRFLKLNAEDPENFGKCVIHLDKTLDKKTSERHKNVGKKFSYSKRKELGLYSLGKKSLKYQEVLPLHKLWLEYMSEYINLEEIRQQNWTNKPDDRNFEQLSLRLYRADYHGSILTVSRSSCPSYVGVSGIVVMETRNCFKLLGSDNTVRIIPKACCVFIFKIQEFQFTFFGKNFQLKLAERSSKKVKTVYVSDLQL